MNVFIILVGTLLLSAIAILGMVLIYVACAIRNNGVGFIEEEED